MFPPDIRNELLNAEQDVRENNNRHCPYINVYLNNCQVKALLDTGSEVSVISHNWLQKNKKYFTKATIFPISNYVITTATQTKERVSQQIYMNLAWSKLNIETPMLVCKRLNQDCIIGVDILNKLQAVIDLQNLKMTCVNNNELISGTLHDTEEEVSTQKMEPLRIQKPSVRYATDEEKKEEDYRQLEGYEKIEELLEEYEDIFNEVPTLTNVYQHRIRVTDPNKFVRRTYAIPMRYEEQVENEIRRMLDNKVIERSNSSFINPLVVVRKKNNDIRLCLDMRNLNNIVEKDFDCAPTADELFTKCEGAKYLTKLDLTSSFWQIPIKEEDRKYTAFLYRNKCYQHRVVPFGLTTSLAAIVKCLERALGDEVEPYTMVFVDDILVISKTLQEHIVNLRSVFEKFRRANISLNIEKCEFMKTSIRFLGHIISEEGVQPDPSKISSITEFPTPNNLKGLRAFLGLTGYYRRFSPEYAKAIQPLLELTRKHVRWKWEQQHTDAMNDVKGLFRCNIMLHHPQKTGKYVIYADASDYAVGSVLYQEDEQQELRVIAYASRVFKGAEKYYSTSEKEILAIVYALKQFRYYIYGTHFEIHTDHQALSFLLKCKIRNARLMRWILAIEEYSFTLKYCKGVDNQTADILSRHIAEDKEETYINEKRELRLLSIKYKASDETKRILRDLATEQNKDEKIRQLKMKQPLENKYTINDDVLFKLVNHEWKVMLSPAMLQTLIVPCHESLGHASSLKCYLSLKEDFIVNNMYRRIRNVLKKCHECQTARYPNLHTYVEMQSIRVKERGELIAVDFLGPMPRSNRGVSNILVIIDVFTKAVRLYAITRPTTKTVLKIILTKYIPKYGRIQKILSDQGKQFQNKLWGETLIQNGIKPILTSIRHPQGNLAERVNKEIGNYVRIYCHNQHNKWAEYLPFFESAINNNYSEATGYPPIELESNVKPTRFWTKYVKKPENQNVPMPHANKLEYAKQRIIKRGDKRIERFNRSHKLVEFALGERVLVKANPVGKRIDNTKKKFFRLYEGPYLLHKKMGKNTFILYDQIKQRELGKYHSSSLRKYKE